MQDYNNLTVRDLTGLPSLGALLGTDANTALISSLNTLGDPSKYFGSSFDTFNEYKQHYIQQVVEPIKQLSYQVQDVASAFDLSNTEFMKIRPCYDEKDLAVASPKLYLPILTHPLVYPLLKQGRIDAYGLTFDDVKKMKEPMDRAIHNRGLTFIYAGMPNDIEHRMMTTEYFTGDPEYTEEEFDAIYETMDTVDNLVRTTDIDPTNPLEYVG